MIFSTDNFLSEKYRKYGREVIDKVEGEFSFALYDRNQDTYLAARDPLGIKPLYYTKTQSGYRFSMDIGELLALPSVKTKPRIESMRTMLECQAVEHHDTMYEGIHRLPPGCMLTIEKDRESIERYWFPEKIETNYSITEEEAAQKLKILFEKAIGKQIDTPEETAFELSGGLDSSSVISILCQKEEPSSIASYSMGFEGVDCDELEYIDSVLQEYPLNHQTIPVADIDYANKYSLEYLYTLSPDWPIAFTFAMSIPMVEQMVKDGKKVIITGQGGDHLFTGTPYMMHTLLMRGKFVSLAKELKHYRHPLKIAKSYALRPSFPLKSIAFVKKLLGKKTDPYGRQDCSYLDADFTGNIKDSAKKLDLDMVTWALHTTLMDGNFFHCAERYFGVEYRHPFFDRELVEFALSLPPEFKFREKKIKWILRKAMKGILPDKVRRRDDKAEFSEVLMRQIDAVDLDELLGDPCIVRLGLIEKEKIEAYIKSYKIRSKKHTVPLWSAINVEYWYRYNGFSCR